MYVNTCFHSTCVRVHHIYTVDRKKRSSTFVIITLENLDGSFAYLETGMNALCKQATYFFILHVT